MTNQLKKGSKVRSSGAVMIPSKLAMVVIMIVTGAQTPEQKVPKPSTSATFPAAERPQKVLFFSKKKKKQLLSPILTDIVSVSEGQRPKGRWCHYSI